MFQEELFDEDLQRHAAEGFVSSDELIGIFEIFGAPDPGVSVGVEVGFGDRVPGDVTFFVGAGFLDSGGWVSGREDDGGG